MIPTHDLTLVVKQPDDATPIPGTWRVWFETVNGVAIDDVGDGLAGSYLASTDEDGVASFALPDTTDEGFQPQNTHCRATFTSADRRVRIKSEPFVMDADKVFEDIVTPTAEIPTPSLAAQAIAAAIAAAGASGLVASATEPTDYAVWFQLDPDTGDLVDIRTP